MFNINVDKLRDRVIPLGHRKEDDARSVTFPLFKYYQEFGYPTKVLVTVWKPGVLPFLAPKVTYPAAPAEGEELTAFDVVWELTELDVGEEGPGEVQVSYYFAPDDQDGNCRTNVYRTITEKSIGDAGPAPDPYTADFIAQVAAIYENLDELSDLDSVPAMIAGIEKTSTTSKAYAAGDLLIYDLVLYKVTAAISQGGALVPGGNLEETTVAEELKSVDITIVDNSLYTHTGAIAVGVAEERGE